MNQIIEREVPAMKPIHSPGRNALAEAFESTGKEARSQASPETADQMVDAAMTKVGLSNLPKMTKVQIAEEGWSGVMTWVQKLPAVVVPGHLRDEAVILSAEMYELLVELATGSSDGEIAADGVAKALLLARIQDEWDERLAVLKDGKSLEAVINSPPRQGKIALGPVF